MHELRILPSTEVSNVWLQVIGPMSAKTGALIRCIASSNKCLTSSNKKLLERKKLSVFDCIGTIAIRLEAIASRLETYLFYLNYRHPELLTVSFLHSDSVAGLKLGTFFQSVHASRLVLMFDVDISCFTLLLF